MKQILNYIESQLENLDKGIIATPSSEKYLKAFAETNNGQNDMLLVEFAKNLGYKKALLEIENTIAVINAENQIETHITQEKSIPKFIDKLDKIRNNKAIAEYMGLYTKKDGYNLQAIGNKGVKYHNSWDWLMPVINRCYQEHMSKEIAEDVMSCDIEKAYNAVIKFITD